MFEDIIKIHAFETNESELGAEISITTRKSRKTFHLPKPLEPEYRLSLIHI